jgi:tRNA1Val (adenine37-N6)-methyltransferase
VIAGACVPEEDEITHDTLLRGRVKLLQPRHGFRSSLDPVLLAGFIVPPFGEFLDIGCASGALSFLLLAEDTSARGQGVEIQARLAALARQGAEMNGFADRYHVVTGDVRTKGTVAAQDFDLVATNPPFRPVGAGVLSPLSEKAMANHEVTLTLDGWLEVTRAALRPGGRLATIFPFDRWEELRGGLAERGFFVARSRVVAPRAGEAPNRILVEARRFVVDAQLESPLLVHDGNGYSAELRRMLGEQT